MLCLSDYSLSVRCCGWCWRWYRLATQPLGFGGKGSSGLGLNLEYHPATPVGLQNDVAWSTPSKPAVEGRGTHGSFFWAMLLGRASQFSDCLSFLSLTACWLLGLCFIFHVVTWPDHPPLASLQVTLPYPSSSTAGPLALTVSLSYGKESSLGSYTLRHFSNWPHCTPKFIWVDCSLFGMWQLMRCPPSWDPDK